MGRLEGRVALVTGSGRGIGRAIALALGGEGAAVAVTSRTRSELDEVVDELESAGGRGFAVTADAMDREAVKGVVSKTIERFGRLDILFNNAGGLVGEMPKLLALSHDD